jgi:ArsR family transcriptional regulator
MKLIQIYECLCDETRLRILNLLSITPLCVSHIQKVLSISQVSTSKHLNYLKERGMAEATRVDNWMLYSLPKESPKELLTNLACLKECGQKYPIFADDVKKLSLIKDEIKEVKNKNNQKKGTLQ